MDVRDPAEDYVRSPTMLENSDLKPRLINLNLYSQHAVICFAGYKLSIASLSLLFLLIPKYLSD